MAVKLDEARIRLLNISGGVVPTANNSLNLGTSSYKWANVYATTFQGNATSATKATQDSDGNAINTTYLKRSGGTMGNNAFINWPDSGSWGSDSATFPLSRGGLYWSGTSDWIRLFAEETSSDMLNLVAQFGDDSNSGIVIRNHSGTTAVSLYATGVVNATTFNGNATSATKLATARTINGTSFDGTSAITTANWGTTRTFTVGNTGKSVNGSGNISWSLAEIGALPLTGGTLTGDIIAPCYTTSKAVAVAPEGTAEGWYRCATFTSGAGTSNNFILSIRRSYYSPENEGYLFSISNAYTTVNITQLNGSTGGHLLTKIRVNIDEDKNIHVDYYMKSNGVASYKNGWYISGWGDGTVYTPILVSSYTGTVTEFETVLGLKNNIGYIGNASTATKATQDASGNTITSYYMPKGYWNWSGQSGQPTWLWGGNSANTYYVYNPSNFNVNSAVKDSSGNTITTSYLRRYDWWTSGNGNDVDTLRAGTTFAYSNHNAPTTGTIVAFDCKDNENYTLQLMGAYQDTNNHLYFRNRNGDGSKWGAWRTVLDDSNYNSYAPTKTGTGASGTWGINISGTAAVASSVAWGNVTGKPGSRFVTYYNTNSEISSTESVSTESYIHTVGASGGSVTTTTKPSGMDNAWGIIHLHLHSGNHAMQLGFGGTTGHMYQRHAYNSSSFGAWKTILDSSNYTSYTVTKTGTGASGSWGINITGSSASCTGNSATATKATQDASGNTITSKYVAVDTTQTISGSKTFSSRVKMTSGYTIHSTAGTSGTVGYAHIATLKITGAYQNAPISFKFIRRNDHMPTIISIQFTNTNGADPTLAAFTGYGYNVSAAYLYKSATSTWDLYITKSEGYDTVHIIDYNNSYNGSVTTTWIGNTQVATLPTGGTTCTLGGSISSATVAATLGKSGGTTGPMKFYWSGQSGQPTWLWGGSDGTNMYVYNPSNFNVNYATSAGSATKATQDASGNVITSYYCTLSTAQTISGAKTFSSRIVDSAVRGGTWISGTHDATFIANTATTSAAGQYYQGWLSGKTQSGAWSLGALSGSEDLYFVYGTDTNYNAGTNTTSSVRFGSGGQVYGAVWNDYAEYRSQTEELKPGHVAYCDNDGKLKQTTSRLQKFEGVVSDTFGFAIGETEEAKTPLAVSGRVLVYTYEDRNTFNSGDCVCAGPDGRVCKMTREEIAYYPDKIVGIVSEIPEYDTWGTDNIDVNGRIWIRIR